jgi:hypothetical protein
MTYERWRVKYRITERQFCCEDICNDECPKTCKTKCGIKKGASTTEEKYERGRFLYKEGPMPWVSQD